MRRHPVRSDRTATSDRLAPRNKAPPVVGATSRGVKLGACVLAVVACLAFWAAPRAGASPRARATRLSESPLVVPGVQALDGGQQVLDQRQARLSSVEAVQAREASQTEYEGLDAERAQQVVGEAFPEVVGDPGGGPPRLPAGQSIVGYPGADAAQVDLGEGRRAVIASSEPMSTVGSSGQRVSIDLSLGEVGGAFEPRTAEVGVRIQKQLGGGVQLPGVGVSLTPLDGEGSPVGGSEGVVDGATAFFADTGIDVGTLVKPVTAGFDLATVLYSERSPKRFSFRVRMPAGASLVQSQDGSVEVHEDGATLALVDAPSAQDAEGTVVPASQSVSGDTLTVVVDHGGGAYRLPVVVDPTVKEDGAIHFGGVLGATWGFHTGWPEHFSGSSFEGKWEGVYFGSAVKDEGKEFAAGESGGFSYATQGESRIYEMKTETSSNAVGSQEEDVFGIENIHNSTFEASQGWLGAHGGSATVCVLPECATGTVEHGVNDSSEAFFEQRARENGSSFTSSMFSAYEYILQEAPPKIGFDTTEKVVGSVTNGMYSGRWMRTTDFADELAFVDIFDPGIGVSELQWNAPGVSGWGSTYKGFTLGCTGVQCNECYEVACGTGPWGISAVGLPDGEDALEVTARDAVGLSATAKGVLKLDNTAPYGIALAGLPPGSEIGYGSYRVKAEASDGSGKTPSSGVASIAMTVDGKEVGKPAGSCTPGPCRAAGEWTLSGEEYVAGKHTITVTATDGAGNEAEEEFTLVMHSAESVAAGPGSVELDSGGLTLSATDVAIASPVAGLEVRRSYNSRNVTVGAKGPLGPQWSGLSLTGSESLKELANGSMVLTAAGGQQSLFSLESGKFASPTGDKNLTLSEGGSGKFTLKDQHGNVTTFTVPSGGSGTTLTPSRREEAGGSRTTTYSFQTVEGVTEPTEALAAVAAGVKCATLVVGCRALSFEYAKATTASGEAPGEWGEYNGRLVGIDFTGWDPSRKEITTTMVAQYSYDGQGRLRAEWDPRISPALKTTYGYDAEGHVTSVTPPGQQPWLFTYGMLAGDTHDGRLLSVVRPSTATSFGNGEAPKDTVSPALSAKSLGAGAKVTVSTGSWSNSPLAYSYQWEECNLAGGECAPILGAVNAGYTIRYVNEGHTLVAQVTASNAAGSIVAVSAHSGEVPVTPPIPTFYTQIKGKGSGQLKGPIGVVYSDSASQFYVTDTGNNRVLIFNKRGEEERSFGSTGHGIEQFKEPTGVAVNREGDVFVADSGNYRIQEFTSSGAYLQSVNTPGAPLGARGYRTGCLRERRHHQRDR